MSSVRSVVLIACLLGLVVTPTKAEEVLCGDEWVRFRPLSAEPFGQKLGYNTYMVRKDHILRGSIAAEGILSLFGYVRIKPMEGDARKNGEFRVSKETYLAIQACLLGQRPTE